MRYSYKDTVKEDVMEWMSYHEDDMDGMGRHERFEYIYDRTWIADEVTGNASGSYTMSRYDARRNYMEDEDSDEYIFQMIEDGFMSASDLGTHIASSNWEWVDVNIRCWLLGDCITEILDEMYED